MRLALEALLVFVSALALATLATAQARFTTSNSLVTYVGANNALTEVQSTTPLPVGR